MTTDGTGPRVSIVVPTFARPSMLTRAVASVLGQSFEDFELLVVDDASPESAEDALMTVSDPRLKVVRHRSNRGSAAARNTGIRLARGEMVAFLDDDDCALPGWLQATVAALSTAPPRVGYVWCGVRDVRALPDGTRLSLRERRWEHFRDGVPPAAAPNVLATGYGLVVRAASFDEVGLFDESLRACVDVDFLLRLGLRFDYAVVPRILIEISHHESGQLTDPSRQRADSYERILDKHGQSLSRLPALRLSLQRKLALLQYQTGERGRGRRTLLAALDGPDRIGTLRRLLSYELGRGGARALDEARP